MKQLQSYGIKVKVIIKRFKTSSYELLLFIFPIRSHNELHPSLGRDAMDGSTDYGLWLLLLMSDCYCYTYL